MILKGFKVSAPFLLTENRTEIKNLKERCEMLKIRLMGTIQEIRWFEKFLHKSTNLDVTEFSKPFHNKGTNRYCRVYAEVECADHGKAQKED